MTQVWKITFNRIFKDKQVPGIGEAMFLERDQAIAAICHWNTDPSWQYVLLSLERVYVGEAALSWAVAETGQIDCTPVYM